MIHRGFYEPLTEAEAAAIVERYDDKAAHLGLNENWREQGWSHYLEWFFAKWLPALETPENSAGLLATLRAIGFLPGENTYRDPTISAQG